LKLYLCGSWSQAQINTPLLTKLGLWNPYIKSEFNEIFFEKKNFFSLSYPVFNGICVFGGVSSEPLKFEKFYDLSLNIANPIFFWSSNPIGLIADLKASFLDRNLITVGSRHRCFINRITVSRICTRSSAVAFQPLFDADFGEISIFNTNMMKAEELEIFNDANLIDAYTNVEKQ